jgi:mannose-6-phosphate isomerase-like protein (cupin superfamily)
MNITRYLELVTAYFSPKVIAQVNDVFIKVAKIKGQDVPWHKHDNEDELFFIIAGSLIMEIEGQAAFVMQKGDIYTVKQGTMHRVSAEHECQLMLIENKSTAHTGDVVAQISKSIDQQLGA